MTRLPLDASLLNAALTGLELQRERIDAQIAELRQLIANSGGARGRVNLGLPGTPKRTMSAAARKRIAEAQRRRWAATKKEQAAEAKGKSAKKTAAASKKAGKKAVRKASTPPADSSLTASE